VFSLSYHKKGDPARGSHSKDIRNMNTPKSWRKRRIASIKKGVLVELLYLFFEFYINRLMVLLKPLLWFLQLPNLKENCAIVLS
jgi:hypothetical protein